MVSQGNMQFPKITAIFAAASVETRGLEAPPGAALPEKRSRVRSSRALPVGDGDLFRIGCSALLFQPVSEEIVALQDVTGRQSVFEQQRVRRIWFPDAEVRIPPPQPASQSLTHTKSSRKDSVALTAINNQASAAQSLPLTAESSAA
jgi:hypothetical protein